MACLRLKGKITILMSVFSLLSLKAGLSATCRPICRGRNCITVNQARVDFKSAEETCRDRDGELMTFQHKTDENTIHILTQGLNGNFWIGLRLPAGACSNLSDPFRGYEWTSGDANRSFIPSFTTWKSSVQVCSSHCVSISSNQRWTESMCSDKTDGFLCRTEHKDACRTQRFPDPTIFQSPEGCSNYPCEHDCTDTKGGYKCSCHPGYIPDKKDPKKCQLHCGKKKCPAKCEKNTDICYCPVGFILNNQFCEDIDECLMKECDQGCKNTFGSFECSCQKGFVLKSHGKCVKAKLTDNSVIATPTIEGSVKPTFNNNTLKVSSAPAVRFLWIWIVVAVTIILLIISVRFYVVKWQRLREQHSNQQSTAVGNL